MALIRRIIESMRALKATIDNLQPKVHSHLMKDITDQLRSGRGLATLAKYTAVKSTDEDKDKDKDKEEDVLQIEPAK